MQFQHRKAARLTIASSQQPNPIGYRYVTPRHDCTSEIAIVASFWTWCWLLSYSMIVNSTGVFLIAQTVGLLQFMATAVLVRYKGLNAAIGSLGFPQVAILIVIVLSLLLQLHGDEAEILSGLIYTSLLAAMITVVPVLWTLDPDHFEKCISIASVILCTFGIAAIAVLGWPTGRDVGHIQVNMFASPPLAAFVLSQFRPGLLGIAVRILSLAMVAVVSSRFAVIGCVAALVCFEMTFRPLSLTKIPAVILAAAGCIFFWPEIVGIMALDDPTRGVSSGVSGRDTQWQSAFDTITELPLGIGFKRATADEAGHNGYLKTLVEFGIPGGGLIIFFLGCILVAAGFDVFRTTKDNPQQRRSICARFAGLTALLFGSFFQPQLLSLGDIFTVTIVFLLFKPATKRPSIRKENLVFADSTKSGVVTRSPKPWNSPVNAMELEAPLTTKRSKAT